MITKNSIRANITAKRKNLTLDQKKLASHQIFNLAIQTGLIVKTQKIAFYLAEHGEIDPFLIMQYTYNMDIKCYLPSISIIKKSLVFTEYKPYAPINVNRYGICEFNCSNYLLPQKFDLVFIPLVAFDEDFNRLGRGGGYYDKSFTFKNNSNASKPLLIGLAYDFQKIKSIPTDPWDIALDGIITNTSVIIKN